jgi:hypothetical protein
MMGFALLGLLAIATAGLVPNQEAAQAAEDLQVHTAVLTLTIRPEVARLRGAGGTDEVPTVFLANRTVALCGAPRAREMPCIRPEEVGALSAFDRFLAAAAGTAIRESFTERNSQSRPLPPWGRPDVVMLDAAGLRRESERLSSPGASGFAGFSAPAYAGTHAVVYAFYLCGNICGYGWLVLLNRSDSGWQVQATHLLWAS